MISEERITVEEDGWRCAVSANTDRRDRFVMVEATAPNGTLFMAFWPHYDRELDEAFGLQLLHET